MNRTKAQVEDSELQPRVSDPARSTSLRWVIGLVAAAVVASAVGFAVLASHQGEDSTGPTPAPAQDSPAAADTAAAQGVAAAFVAHDADAATPYLAPGAELWDGWRRHWERDAAWSVEVLMEPCVPGSGASIPTEFTCPFAMNLMGSRQVGSGPFADNALTISVTDGKVSSAHREMPFETNGLGRHLDSVFAWVEANHPDDVAFLGQDELEMAQDDWPRWLRLWKQYIAEYVAANEAG
jgi:hypothetical protein